MKYDKSRIMKSAWKIAKDNGLGMSEALWRAWLCADLNGLFVDQAKADAGITEEVHSWAGWKALGYTVRHGSRCLMQARLWINGHVDGASRIVSFFGRSQVEKIPV